MIFAEIFTLTHQYKLRAPIIVSPLVFRVTCITVLIMTQKDQSVQGAAMKVPNDTLLILEKHFLNFLRKPLLSGTWCSIDSAIRDVEHSQKQLKSGFVTKKGGECIVEFRDKDIHPFWNNPDNITTHTMESIEHLSR